MTENFETTVVRWPTPYEWGSLLIASGAFVVSALSYSVSDRAESAQGEQVSLVCDIGYPEFIRNPDDGTRPATMRGKWTATVYNNSRASVTIKDLSVAVKSSESGHDKVRMKIGAGDAIAGVQHLRDLFLESAKPETITFTIAIDLPRRMADHIGFDASQEGRPSDSRIANLIELVATTGRDNQFTTTCPYEWRSTGIDPASQPDD